MISEEEFVLINKVQGPFGRVINALALSGSFLVSNGLSLSLYASVLVMVNCYHIEGSHRASTGALESKCRPSSTVSYRILQQYILTLV